MNDERGSKKRREKRRGKGDRQRQKDREIQRDHPYRWSDGVKKNSCANEG